MLRQPLIEFNPVEYESSGIESAVKPYIMADGSRNVLVTGNLKPQAYKGSLLQVGKLGSRFMTQAGDGFAGLGAFGDLEGIGSVARVMAGLFFSGAGTLYYNGVSQAASASSILQLKLLASGAFGATYQAGLSQPSAPTIATRTSLGVGMSGKLKNGTYSIKIYKIRSATGARSVASEASNLAVAVETDGVGQSLRVTFPAADTNGGDRWGVCVTPRSFGSTGPYFLYKEIDEADLGTVDSVARSVEIEWSDGDLVDQPLAPVDSYPPPACVFCGALGNSVFVDGAYGDTVDGVSASNPGTVIASSLPLRPEEFPLDWLSFPPDAPTALLRGGDGFYYRFGRNSLGVISYTGGEPAITYQLYWGTTGVAYPHNAVVAEGGRLYAKTGTKGLVRIGAGGEPDAAWAVPVLDDLENLSDAETVLGWDENNQTVCVMNGTTVWPFNSTLEKWGAPLDLSGEVTGRILSAATYQGALYFSCLDAASINLYKFNAGTGSVMKVFTDWSVSADKNDYIRQILIYMRADSTNPVTVRVFKNEDAVTPVFEKQLTPEIGKPSILPVIDTLIPDLNTYCVYLEQETAGGDAGFERVVVKGYSKLK
ncbi:MAG: hypothetical protein JSS81_07470 [Acidobacteria bacterium]|nr:hypothetical protein [Acidobacteriota bacterium]